MRQRPPDVVAQGLLEADVPLPTTEYKEVDGTRYGTRVLPPICGAPLPKKQNGKPGTTPEREAVPLLPSDMRALDLTTYDGVCTRGAGWRTTHPGVGYCKPCEKKWNSTLNSRKNKQGIATARELKTMHDAITRKLDFLGAPIDITPHEALLQEVQRTAGLVVWFEDILEKAASDKENPFDDVMIQYTKLGVTPSATWQMYQWERQHLVDVSRIAIKAGVAERKVQIAEQQGRLIAAVMQAFILSDRLGLSYEQRQKAPAVIAEILMAHRNNQTATPDLPERMRPILDVASVEE
ncbi:MAG: hypothetical protein E6R03_12735 [Hyphomicrobiaceae bacterium]|nr:MAG: hypothetical protein E6R03_12735 [Hyphomicrobiaceae bacterium]